MGSNGNRVLLVEDNKLDQMAFKRMVERREFAYDCTIAGSVSEARNILDSESFDVVISDYMLGDGTAFDVLKIVKDTPFIFITGAGDEETAVRAWQSGACDYLVKDTRQNYLKAVPITIENAIKHKEMVEELHLLSHAVMSTDDSIYITDMENKIIFVNRAFCETYGYEREEIIGNRDDIFWDENPSIVDTRSVSRGISGWETGFYHKRKNGSKFSISLSRSGIRNEKGNNIAVVSVVRDISDRILVESELRDDNMRLKKKSQIESESAVAASEKLEASVVDLNRILSSVRAGDVGQLGADLQENLEAAQKDVDNIKDILSDFFYGLKDTHEIDEGSGSHTDCDLEFGILE